MSGDIMSARDVAEWLGVSPTTVRKLAGEGKIPGVQVASLWRFSRSALERWVEQGGVS